MSVSPVIMQSFLGMSDEQAEQRIAAAKQALGGRVVVLGHHYQREEVYRYADITGDSLRLSRQAAQSQADFIVFCGVHFMAEVADILARPGQVAILPDLAAGCAMADMASLAQVQRAWRELDEMLGGVEDRVTPVTYINSAADLKAFCGTHGGIVCTSSNAQQVLEWSFNQREKVLFFPDQHLGRNTAYRKMGIPLDEMVVWDYELPNGGLTAEQVQKARMILWKGFCSVHQMFKPDHIDRFRAKYPDAKVISHPENSLAVCEKSDFVGSTEFIINTLTAAPAGSRWLVGTELNLVNRMQHSLPDKHIHFMAPTVCMCSTMFRISPQHLAWTLESLVAGKVVNQIKVAEADRAPARLALERMFAVSP